MIPDFSIVGGGNDLVTIAVPGRASNDRSVRPEELFVFDGKDLLQLTNFGRSDTIPLFLGSRRRALFATGADSLGTNPTNTLQTLLDRRTWSPAAAAHSVEGYTSTMRRGPGPGGSLQALLGLPGSGDRHHRLRGVVRRPRVGRLRRPALRDAPGRLRAPPAHERARMCGRRRRLGDGRASRPLRLLGAVAVGGLTGVRRSPPRQYGCPPFAISGGAATRPARPATSAAPGRVRDPLAA